LTEVNVAPLKSWRRVSQMTVMPILRIRKVVRGSNDDVGRERLLCGTAGALLSAMFGLVQRWPGTGNRRAGLPLRVYLRRLIWLCMLPVVLLASYLAFDNVRKVRAADDRASERLASQIASAVDLSLQARMDALSALSRSPLLDDTQRLADFHRAAQAVRRTFGGEVVLADLSGQMLVHTAYPFGNALPTLPRPGANAAVPKALASGGPAVGDSFIGPLAKMRLVAIAAPVGPAGNPHRVLLNIVDMRQLQQVVDQVSLPQGWSVSIRDGANEVLVARPLPASSPQASGDEGGARLVVASKISPWSAVLVSSAESRMAPVLAAAQALGIAILGATLVGLLAGTYASRRLANSVASLTVDDSPPDHEIAEISAARKRLEESMRQREAARDAMRTSEVEAQTMFEAMSDALIYADPQRRIRRVNPAFVTIFGYSADEVIGRTTEFLYADPADYAAQGRLRFQVQPDPPNAHVPYELRYRRKDGTDIWTESVGRTLAGPDGEVRGAFAMHRDITAQKQARLDLERHRLQAEAELRSRDMRLTGLIESAMDAVISIDARHEIVLFNAAAERMFGYEASAVLGERLEILLPARLRASHDAHIEAFQRTGVTARRMGNLAQVAGLRADGAEFPAEASISQLRVGDETTFTVILRDITERVQAEQGRLKLEAQLLQAQKMEALGTLAGGIAHDFNNILTAISGNVELARLDTAADSPLQHNLAETAKATQRASDLVRQILTFSRRQPLERVTVDLRELALEAVKLLRSTLPASIELVTTFASESPKVLADRTQLHQVLMNLVVNAAQAIGRRPGRIEISLESATTSGDASIGALPHGRYARLSVVDDGPGMDAATRVRIFDPFFTTKPVGEGTGLGLAVVDGIVKRFGGAITVYTEPGRGCAFHLYFPAANTDAVVEATPTVSARHPGRNQRVIYLDDDDALVLIGQAMLQRLGYRVDGYTDAAQALAAFEADPTSFDALITDFNMPGASGLQTAMRVLQLKPDFPVALASGLVTDDLLMQAQALGVREVIYKPHSLDDLAGALHRMLTDED
jgi:two-component system cell cycle sensor histidine kinase/response regulator CckA